MPKYSPKLLVSKATTLPTKQRKKIKKRWLLNKIKLTWEKKTVFHCKEWWAASLFILFPGLFEIVAQSADGTAILFLGMHVDVVRKWVLLDFLHFGVLSHTEKGTKMRLISPNWLCWVWVPLYRLDRLIKFIYKHIYIYIMGKIARRMKTEGWR